MYEVFKAVTPTEDPNMFLSYYNSNVARLVYRVGESTKTHDGTPIFVFDTYDNAREYEGIYNTKIMRGYSTEEPHQLTLIDQTLDTDWLQDPTVMRKFWHDVHALSPIALKYRYRAKLQYVPNGTLLVPNFTPVEVITPKNYW